MSLSPSDKEKNYRCYLCGSGNKQPGIWKMVGYDENGELWICPSCGEKHKTDAYLQDIKEVYEQPEPVNGSL